MDKHQSRILRPVTVSRVYDLNARMRRVMLSGESVAFFNDAPAGAWVKVFFTPPGEPEGPGRAYTISHLDPESQSMYLDFVKHGDGPAMQWINKTQPGDIIRIAGPREGLNTEGLTSLLLFGDETAIPGIFAILNRLKSNVVVQVFILKDKTANYALPAVLCALNIHWLESKKESLFDCVTSCVTEQDPDMVWGAGEHSEMIRIRKHMLGSLRLNRKKTDITAYWKLGEADHRDT